MRGLVSNNDLTTHQLSALIDGLLAVQARRDHASAPDHADPSRGSTRCPVVELMAVIATKRGLGHGMGAAPIGGDCAPEWLVIGP